MKDLRHNSIVRFLAIPISWLYGFVVWFRNRIYDAGVFKSVSPDIPTICVGNLTVGGTGKTPFVEYLVQILLNQNKQIGVLSRGYGRKSKGCLFVEIDARSEEVGDESLQIKRKFPNVMVVVCERRIEGIDRMIKRNPQLDLILLDDAFQHRELTPGYSFLLVDYNRPIFEDRLLPRGNLREPMEGIERANRVLITKCPAHLKPIDYRIFFKNLHLKPHQRAYFSRLSYGFLMKLFPDDLLSSMELKELAQDDTSVLIVSAIASSVLFEDEVRRYRPDAKVLRFPDHHLFTVADLTQITALFNSFTTTHRYLIVTEKDGIKLRELESDFTPEIRCALYQLPVRIEFIDNAARELAQSIYEYVRNHKRDSILH